jgi:hypothetical protein
MRDEQIGLYFRELVNQFFGLQYLNYFMWIRDGKNSYPGSGMENIRIRDKHPGSATLVADPYSNPDRDLGFLVNADPDPGFVNQKKLMMKMLWKQFYSKFTIFLLLGLQKDFRARKGIL